MTAELLIGELVLIVIVMGVILSRAQGRHRSIRAAFADRLEARSQLIALDLLDAPTHGTLLRAAEVLVASRDRLVTLARPIPDRELETVVAALDVVEQLERAIQDSKHTRDSMSAAKRVAALGGLAAENDYHPDGDPMRLYQDPLNLPEWISSSRVRDILTRMGAILDDVRLLHDAVIESAVLMFTLWARLILLATAPLLASATFGHVPLDHGFGLRDVPWMLALTTSAITALASPWITLTAMAHSEAGARLRRLLVAVEAPITIAALFLTPCWPVAAFAAGWSNWWQRHGTHLGKGIVWLGVVVAALVAGLANFGLSADEVAPDVAVAIAIIAMIGGSYGAMLPVTISMLVRVLVGGLRSPSRARHRADRQLGVAVGELLEAARVIEATASRGYPQAQCDAVNLRDIAATLALGADRKDQWGRRVPLDLESLLDEALARAGAPPSESAQAVYIAAEARRMGEAEPLTFLPPNFYDDWIKQLRFRRRRDAQTISRLIVEIIGEARRYGTGPLVTRCRCDEARLQLRFANAIRTDNVRPGRSTGADRLSKLIGLIADASLDVRDLVDGSFVDLPPQARRFGVQVSLPLSLLERTRT